MTTKATDEKSDTFFVERTLDLHGLEVKAKENVSPQELKSLRMLAEEVKLKRFLCVSLGSQRRRSDEVAILPWKEFLAELWSGAYR